MLDIYDLVRKVEEALRKGGISADVYQYRTLPLVAVEINWGDWKHEHLRADWLVREIGGKLVKSWATEENGSDCYSGVHVYGFI